MEFARPGILEDLKSVVVCAEPFSRCVDELFGVLGDSSAAYYDLHVGFRDGFDAGGVLRHVEDVLGE